ncbi:MAG: hypothetical protein GWP44_08195, partial [Proteobacteria bacterium]|nr:hypothetical protein [Pseudomonadota bacterium]
RAWDLVPAVVESINDYITTHVPAFYRKLDAAGVRPDPGEPVAVPRRGGR